MVTMTMTPMATVAAIQQEQQENFELKKTEVQNLHKKYTAK